jgi:signal transduction histidine kinase
MAVSEHSPTTSNGTSGEPYRLTEDRRSSDSRIDSGPSQVIAPARETWSLRRQLIVPLGATILLVALAVSAITWWAAQDSQRRWAAEKMDTVYEQLRQASYPLTERVIDQIKSYSGVDAILIRKEGAPVTTLSQADYNALAPTASDPRSSVAIGTWTLGDRLFHYRSYTPPQNSREDGFKELVLLVRQPRDSGVFFAPVWAPIASGLVSVAAMILVTTIVGSRIVRRIEDLETQVVRIAQGKFEVMEPRGPNDAIRRLSVSINSMSSQLAKAQDWIARTERSRLISMIAGGMAHQLRNALTGASLLVQSFIRSHAGERVEELSMAEQQLKLAAEAVRRLLASDPNVEMVDEPEMTAHSIMDAARDCVATYAEHQQVAMTWDLGERNHDTLVPQGSAVAGAIVNLLMNAIEATGRGGQVQCTMECQTSPRQVLWRIVDNGPGPDPTLANSIMEPFVTSKKEGVGLGLAMAARVAKRCHGSLSWRREQEHTIFELVIPSSTGKNEAP